MRGVSALNSQQQGQALSTQQQALLDVARLPLGGLHGSASSGLEALDTSWVLGGGHAEQHARLAVYRHAYFARLVECLAEDYSILRQSLGSQFETLALAFIEQIPSRSPNLNAYGAPFAAFIRASAQRFELSWLEEYAFDSGETAACFFAELATLEWALVEVVHEASYPALDAGVLAALAPEEWSSYRLKVNDSLRLLRTEFPVGAFFQDQLDVAEDDAAPPFPMRRAECTAVCRRGVTVWRVNIAPALLPILEALRAGAALEAAFNDVLQAGGVEPEALQRAFADWIACGFFVDPRTNDDQRS